MLCAPAVCLLAAREKNLALGLLDCTRSTTQQGQLIMVKGGAAVNGRTLINKVQNIYSILYTTLTSPMSKMTVYVLFTARIIHPQHLEQK